MSLFDPNFLNQCFDLLGKQDLGPFKAYINFLLGQASNVAERRKVLNACNVQNESLLFVAAKQGRTEAVRFLLAFPEVMPNIKTANLTPLLVAAKRGHDKVVNEIIASFFKEGISINECTPNYESALYFSVLYNHISTAELLLQHGANPNLSTSDGTLPIHVAKSKAMFELLLIKHACGIGVDLPKKVLEYNIDYTTVITVGMTIDGSVVHSVSNRSINTLEKFKRIIEQGSGTCCNQSIVEKRCHELIDSGSASAVVEKFYQQLGGAASLQNLALKAVVQDDSMYVYLADPNNRNVPPLIRDIVTKTIGAKSSLIYQRQAQVKILEARILQLRNLISEIQSVNPYKNLARMTWAFVCLLIPTAIAFGVPAIVTYFEMADIPNDPSWDHKSPADARGLYLLSGEGDCPTEWFSYRASEYRLCYSVTQGCPEVSTDFFWIECFYTLNETLVRACYDYNASVRQCYIDFNDPLKDRIFYLLGTWAVAFGLPTIVSSIFCGVFGWNKSGAVANGEYQARPFRKIHKRQKRALEALTNFYESESQYVPSRSEFVNALKALFQKGDARISDVIGLLEKHIGVLEGDITALRTRLSKRVDQRETHYLEPVDIFQRKKKTKRNKKAGAKKKTYWGNITDLFRCCYRAKYTLLEGDTNSVELQENPRHSIP